MSGAVDGDVLYLRQSDPTNDITIKHGSGGTGDFDNDTGADIVYNDTRGLIHAVYRSTNTEWVVLSSRIT